MVSNIEASLCCVQIKGFGSAAAPTPVPAVQRAAPDAAGPLCSAPQTVEGSTFIVARPGRARELATMLESHPMLVRKPCGTLRQALTYSKPFALSARWPHAETATPAGAKRRTPDGEGAEMICIETIMDIL